MCGKLVRYVWEISGKCVGNWWEMCVKFMEMCVKLVGYVCKISGKYVGNMWEISGKCVRN